VFFESASYISDMDAPGRKESIKKISVNENHVTIAYSPAMMTLITGLLK
jgi:hypothetical protein